MWYINYWFMLSQPVLFFSQLTFKSSVDTLYFRMSCSPQTDLEEERIKQKIADRTRKEKCRIYLIRLLLNLFVIAVLAACFYSIYVATIFSQQAQMINIKVAKLTLTGPVIIMLPPGDVTEIHLLCSFLQENFMVDLIYEYLPSIVITMANFVTPLLFSVIINFEDYSPAFEIRFTLMRCCWQRPSS